MAVNNSDGGDCRWLFEDHRQRPAAAYVHIDVARAVTEIVTAKKNGGTHSEECATLKRSELVKVRRHKTSPLWCSHCEKKQRDQTRKVQPD